MQGGPKVGTYTLVLIAQSLSAQLKYFIQIWLTTTTGSRNYLSNWEIFVFIFFSNEGSISHLFDSLDSRIESNFIGLCLAIRITFVLKKWELLLLRRPKYEA